MAAPEERFLSTEEVAERLQVDEQTVRRWIKSGKLEAVKPGREWRIPPSAFEALLESYSSPKAPASSPEVEQGRREDLQTVTTALTLRWDVEAATKLVLSAIERVEHGEDREKVAREVSEHLKKLYAAA